MRNYQPMIQVRSVSKYYGNLKAVDDISFDVGADEIVLINVAHHTVMAIGPPNKAELEGVGAELGFDLVGYAVAVGVERGRVGVGIGNRFWVGGG